MRGKLKNWRAASIRSCKGRCVLSGRPYQVVHHIISFNTILDEALRELKLKHYECIYDYSFEELEALTKLVIDKHFEYGLGVCLTEELHNKFHKLYGTGNNTREQWEAFTRKYRSRKG